MYDVLLTFMSLSDIESFLHPLCEKFSYLLFSLEPSYWFIFGSFYLPFFFPPYLLSVSSHLKIRDNPRKPRSHRGPCITPLQFKVCFLLHISVNPITSYLVHLLIYLRSSISLHLEHYNPKPLVIIKVIIGDINPRSSPL